MSTDYTAREGDCVDSIAHEHGFFPDTIWNHADNSELKRLRRDPNVLEPGDTIVIPDLREGEATGATEKKHRFRRKGIPAKLRMVFYRPAPPEEEEDDADAPSSGGGEDDESVYEETEPTAAEAPWEPITDAPCTIEIDGQFTDERSDGEGLVQIPIPPAAQGGKITFYPGTPEELTFPLDLGRMDPVDSVIGLRKRLANMGYRCAPEGDEVDSILKDALMRFQQEHDLDATGEADQATKDKLVEEHGS